MLREFGVDPGAIAARAGLDPAAQAPGEDNSVRCYGPTIISGSARRRHDGRISGYWLVSEPILGIWKLVLGQLMKHSRTLGTALRAFSEFQHLHSRGGVTFLLEKEQPLATLYYAIYEKNVEHIDQIYDGIMAMACNVVRDLCGTAWGPSEVVFLRTRGRPSSWTLPSLLSRSVPFQFGPNGAAVWRGFAGASDLQRRSRSAFDLDSSQIQARDQFELVPRLRRVLRALLVAGTSARDDVVVLLMHRRT